MVVRTLLLLLLMMMMSILTSSISASCCFLFIYSSPSISFLPSLSHYTLLSSYTYSQDVSINESTLRAIGQEGSVEIFPLDHAHADNDYSTVNIYLDEGESLLPYHSHLNVLSFPDDNDNNNNEHTNLYLSAFLLFLFIYSSPSPSISLSLLLPSPCSLYIIILILHSFTIEEVTSQ